ncbi:HBS1-like protein isoform X2 [Zingiber officinale]|uniref:HBS1-like protein isoform X2 n=1 Tax=Zingiber officinale TaxID=94328 RepID=UPI001C4B69C4|nr:HBS1-like protein isoform X2 [Zingiber officinale]
MPRKVSYGLDYDDDYDTYDDYDYEHEVKVDGYDDYEDNVTSQLGKDGSKHGIWQCPICSYDNDESSFCCDICGAIYVYSSTYGKQKVNPATRDTGASAISKSHAQIYVAPRTNNLVDEFKSRKPNLYEQGQPEYRRGESNSKGKEAQVLSSDNETLVPSVHGSKVSSDCESESSHSRENMNLTAPLSSNLNQLKLGKHPIRNKKVNSKTKYQPEEWMLMEKEPEILKQLNLAIVGHVDSGKSTLSGRLLHLLGKVSKKEMHKYEKEAKEKGKGSFAYAWAMDESPEERERGVTMTVAVAYFDSKKYHVVLLDSPGHKDFVPNMISGAAQADAAVLVVDASTGSFEAGMDGYGIGQTREHAQLVRSFGVEQIIVAVNKMDVVGYSKERFDFIKSQLGAFLRSCGFKDSSIIWVPLSVVENQNLVTTSADVRLSSWCQGVCLLDAIDSLQTPLRDVSKSLILPICDVVKTSMGQVAACGKLETGAIRNGSKVLVMPIGALAAVRSIERDSISCNLARAGDHIAVTLQAIETGHVLAGGVLCHPDYPVQVATCLELKILVLDIPTPILVGSQVEFHIHHAKVAGRVSKMVVLLDQKTGKVSKTAPRILKGKQSAIIEVRLDGAVCAEEFSKSKALGRAFLRSSGTTIAVGIVTRIVERKS